MMHIRKLYQIYALWYKFWYDQYEHFLKYFLKINIENFTTKHWIKSIAIFYQIPKQIIYILCFIGMYASSSSNQSDVDNYEIIR